MSGASRAKRVLFVSAAALLTVSFFLSSALFQLETEAPTSPEVYVGVDAAFASVEETKQLIDEVKSYTNLFVVGSTAVTWNLTNLNDVCQYLYDSGLHFMTFAHPAAENFLLPADWLMEARERWDSSFLGLYAYDEPGGHQVDHDYFYMCAQEASSYVDAASTYVQNLTFYLSLIKDGWNTGDFPLFTSDYALHEYDYRAGYEAVFTEFWKNNSRPIAVALGRGAATVHGRDWGVMITGHVNDTGSGQQMYEDMVYAYEQGAKYILVFDYPSLSEGILQREHLDAMKLFYQYAQTHKREETSVADRVAYVVPKDYGCGFRGPTEKIWGLFEANAESLQIWSQTESVLQLYGATLDFVYEDCPQLTSLGYSRLIFWNGTEIRR